MATTAPKIGRSSAAKKPTLAAAAAAVTKNILGAVTERPRTIELPQAVSEIHVSPEDVIPAGTVITREIADAAGLEDEDLQDLIDAGHATLVEVYAMGAVADTPQA